MSILGRAIAVFCKTLAEKSTLSSLSIPYMLIRANKHIRKTAAVVSVWRD